ncbi:MAG: hypothetical protein NUW21_06595, partial [Elusimicrobia bacterium]|nr:hypothetical protein [Elusimicrobiota bacterium]
TGYSRFDNNPPISVRIFPTDLASPNAFGREQTGLLSSLSSLFGTASDGVGESGVGREEYRLQDASTGKWWFSTTTAPGTLTYGNTPLPGFFTLTVGQVAPWNVGGTTTTVPWEVWQATGIPFDTLNGHGFQLNTRAVDTAGNYETVYSTVNFIYDSGAPASAVSYPGNNDTFSAQLTVISGTTIDQPQPFNSGIFQMSLGIQRTSDGSWWTSSGWQAVRDDVGQPGVTLNTAVNPNEWSYSVPAGFWTGIGAAERFSLYAWAGDNVQNEVVSSTPSVQNAESSTTLKSAFNYEVVPPSSTISAPADQVWYSNQPPFTLTTLSGTANDNPAVNAAGVSTMFVEIRDEDACPSCLYWNETTKLWQATSIFNQTGFLDPAWSLTGANLTPTLISGRTYRVRSRARDAAVDAGGNPNGTYESPADIVLAQQTGPAYIDVHFFHWDGAVPTTVVTSPPDGGTPSSVPSINGTAADNPAGFKAGLGKTFVALCQDAAGAPDTTKCLTAPTAGGTFTG